MQIRIDFAQQLLLQQYRVSRPDLVTTGGKTHSVNYDDLSIDAGQLSRQNNVVDLILRVTPGDYYKDSTD